MVMFERGGGDRVSWAVNIKIFMLNPPPHVFALLARNRVGWMGTTKATIQ